MRKQTPRTRPMNLVLPTAATLLAFGCLAILCSFASAQEAQPPPPRPGEPAATAQPQAPPPPPPANGPETRWAPEGPPPPPDCPPDAMRCPRSGEDCKQVPECHMRFYRGEGTPPGPPFPPGGEFERHERHAVDPVKLFKEMDANGDGMISKEEFMEYYARIGLSGGPCPAGPGGPEHRVLIRRFGEAQGAPPEGPDRLWHDRGMKGRQGPPPPPPSGEFRGPGGPPPDRPGPPPQEPRDLH